MRVARVEPGNGGQNEAQETAEENRQSMFVCCVFTASSLFMAVEEDDPNPKPSLSMDYEASALLSSYLGLSFAVFLGLLPRSSVSQVFSLQSRNRILSLKLFHAEEQLRQMRSRRKEDSKANARVVEIFATHRHAWQQEEKSLLHRIDVAAEEIAGLRSQIDDMESSETELRCSVERLKQEVAEREEMLDFLSRRAASDEGITKKEVKELLDEEEVGFGENYKRNGRVRAPTDMCPVPDPCFDDRSQELDEIAMIYCRENGFGPDSLMRPEISKRWIETPSGGWQDIQFDSHESNCDVKHLIVRREYPWNLSGDVAAISSKLNLLEENLSNMEKAEKEELSKVPFLLRKQAKRYRSLAGKIDDLCRRMEVSDGCEGSLSPNFRTQRQTEFLVEALKLEHRTKETRERLNTLDAEMTGKSHLHPTVAVPTAMTMPMRRSLDDSMRSNLKEIQRNLEIWLARIMGDLEGVLARDGNSRVRDYYISRYPFVRY